MLVGIIVKYQRNIAYHRNPNFVVKRFGADMGHNRISNFWRHWCIVTHHGKSGSSIIQVARASDHITETRWFAMLSLYITIIGDVDHQFRIPFMHLMLCHMLYVACVEFEMPTKCCCCKRRTNVHSATLHIDKLQFIELFRWLLLLCISTAWNSSSLDVTKRERSSTSACFVRGICRPAHSTYCDRSGNALP